ncbi:MAG: hypothetical protein KGJ07_10365, partial [Patescibacteria group bacterium]|nr:hypothetical protein [Patescibacteria group bacterium]
RDHFPGFPVTSPSVRRFSRKSVTCGNARGGGVVGGLEISRAGTRIIFFISNGGHNRDFTRISR